MSWDAPAAPDDRTTYGYDQPDLEDDISSDEGFMKRPKWLTNKILIIIIIILFFLGLAFLIAGSIMLGIGVSKSHKNCPTVTATPYYATVESTRVTYADVLNNYQKAVDIITAQIRAALSSSPSSNMAILDSTANSDPYITVLGLSQSPRGSVMAVVGMAYTSADAPPLTSIETDLNNGQDMTLYHAGSTAAPSSDQQMCSMVSVYQMNNGTTMTPKTTSFWTNPPNSQGTTTVAGTTTTTVATIPTVTPCVCPTTVCPSQAVCPTPTACPTCPTPTVCPTTGPTTSTTSTMTPTTTTSPTATSIGSTSQTTSHSTSSTGSTHSTAPSPTTTSSTSTTTNPPTLSPTVGTTTTSLKSTTTTATKTSPGTATTTKTSTSTSTSTSTGTSPTSTTTSPRSTTTTVTSSTSSSPRPTTTTTMKTTPSTTVTTQSSTKATTGSTSTAPSTSTSTTSAAPTTTSTTPSTTTACIPVTTPSPRPGARDVVLLIDDSTAVGKAANYNQMTSWLGKQLFPQWPVSSEKWEAAPAQYALKEYNLLMDFDANNVNELGMAVTTSVYSGRNLPSVTKALKSTLGLAGRPGVHRVILLLSASSNLTDLETALPLAEQAKGQGVDIITMALGGADGGELGLLASGPDYIFSTGGFSPSADQATAITDLIQGGSRTTAAATTSTSSTTSSPPIADFPCHPDIAVLVDTSEAVPTQEEYERQLSFISDQLAPSWSISHQAVETEIIVYSTFYNGFIGDHDFNYDNYYQFADVVHQYDYFYNRVTPASINGTLNYYATTIDNRRSGRQPTTLLFAYSGDKADIVAARSTLPSVGNLIVVGMGSQTQYLSLLTGNVITGMDYGDQLVQQINTLLCSSSTPVPLPSTQVQTTTSSQSTTTTPTTTSPTATGTTVVPQTCPDCIPDEANILIAMDSSSLMTGGKLDQLKSFVNGQLTANWTHSERLAILGFDTRTRFSAPVDFGDLNSMDEFHKLVSVSPQLSDPPSLTSAFRHALNNFHPISKFGQQKSVIFTASADPSDIANASFYADLLSQRGIVVLIGMNLTDVGPLQKLAPSVIPWPDLSNTSGIANQINQGLAGAFLNYTTVQPSTSTVPTGSTVSTTVTTPTTPTTMGTTTVFTASPAICSRDVILLLDESNAYPDLASFNQVKTWLIKTLVPLWEVNPSHIAVAPYGFANKTFDDLGGNFLENSQSELETLIDHNLLYLPTTTSSVHYGLSKAVGISARPGAAVVLVSASDAADDINQAMDYAKQLKMNGGTVITLSVGPNFSGQLPKLSSGLSFFFYSPGFAPSNEIAMDISDVLCSSAPPVTTTPGPTTAAPPTTTTTTPPSSPFPCTVDVAFLFDNSGRNSNASIFNETVTYVADQLIQNWIVDSNHTEAAIVMANSILPITDSQSWRYRDHDELQETLHQMGHDFFGGAPSIYNLLEGLQEVASSRRTFNPLTAVMFTYSTDQEDVLQSVALANSLGVNIIAVGLGTSDPNILGLLTGNVATGMILDDQLTSWIDVAICNPKPPVATVAPTTKYVTTTSTTLKAATSTSTSTTTSATTTTPLPPEGCPDCYPDMANILIIVDNSFEQSSSTFSNQMQVVQNLVAAWTHMERMALASYASSLSQLINYDDLAPADLHGLQIIISNIQQTRSEEDLGKSLHQATSIVPNPIYGEQRTIVFTTTPGANDKATQAGENLRGKGQLIVVGIGMTDVSGLAALASPGDAIPWSNVDDTTTVVQDILGAIGATTRRPTESTTSGTAATTTIGSTTAATTLPPNVISCQKDVLLLIDESNAYGGQDNFAKTKNWIVNSLLPTWNINPSHVAAVASGYANKSWNNIGGDFGDVGSIGELQTMINGQLFYLASKTPSLTFGLKNAVAVSQPEMVTVLVSASEDPDDINMAYNYAVKLKEYGAAVITLFVGPTSKGYLGQLSSGSNYSFASTDYSPSTALANQISSQICGPEPLFTTTQPPTTTTLPTTTVTTASPPFNCNPDVAFLFDSSAVNSNDTIIANVVNFVADNVVKNWQVNEQTTEAAPVFATTGHSLYGRGYWSYDNRGELQDALHTMAGYGVFQGDPSVKALLNSLQSIVQHRRQTAPLTAVMFTFSTDYQDVVNSLTIEKKLGANIVAVGLGTSDMSTLSLLTGNVIIPTALGDDLAAFINGAICNPKAPISQVTTTAAPTSTTSPSTTATTVTTTTVVPEGCPDCYPPMANLLLMIDNSANQTATTLSDQKQAAMNLISSWNHLERFSLATFADSFSQITGYNDNVTLATLQKIINAIQQTNKPADLGRSLHMAAGIAPVNVYGVQQTILFTTTVDSSDKAMTSAKTLQKEGQLVVVGVAMADASQLAGLASPASAIAWINVNDTAAVVQDIMADLGAATRAPTESTVSATSQTSTMGSTTATTTLPPNVISCQKDVLLLVDTSNSFGGQDNFTATKNWIVNTLIPTWNVDPNHVASIAFGFANKSWNNIGGDFGDVGSVAEFQKMLNGQLFYTPTRGHAIAYALKNAMAVSRPQTVVILISASEDPTDIGDSIQYAMKLKEYGGAVITLAVGPTAKGYLGQLSSGLNYSYASKDYAVSAAVASQISSQICGPEPLFTTTQPPTTTTLPTTTVTTASPPFNCNPDVAFLFDSSAVNSNDTIIANVVNFVADNVVKNWQVNEQTTEAAPVFATTGHSLYGRGYWSYDNRGELQDALHTMAGYGVFQGDPSVKALLNSLQSIVQHRRQTAPLTAVMFTFSTDYQDVVNSLTIEKKLGANIVAVGLGTSDMSTLSLLTGNVIIPTALGDDLAAFINGAICNPKAPISQVTTTAALPTTTRASSTSPPIVTLPTTTVTPEGCPDCVPAMANLFLMIDNSANQTAATFSDQKQAVLNLISTWNHFERFSLATYADSLSQVIGYNDNVTLAVLQKIVNELQQTTKPADLGRSLHMATDIAPVTPYGQQQTVLFTTTTDNSDKATTAAGILQKKGQLIAVGVAMADVSPLAGLASPGSAIAWSNVNDTQDVVDNIMQDLLPMTTVSTTRSSSTSTVTSATTAGSTGTPSSTPTFGTSDWTTASSSMAQTTTSTVTGPTTTTAPICTKDLILLMDDSNAIPNQDNFNQLKTWIISTFLVQLQNFIQVDPVSFDDKMYQDIGQGFLPSNVVGFPMNDMYNYNGNAGPNITKALQKASTIIGPDGPTSTLLISASSAAGDVANAAPYATQMKTNGVFITLLVGSAGDGLLPLATGSDKSFSTAGFSPDDATLSAILAALCPGSISSGPTTIAATSKTTTAPATAPTTRVKTTTGLATTSGNPTVTQATTTTTASSATTVTTTTGSQAPTTTVDLYIPTKEDIVIVFDTSNDVNGTTVSAQQQLVLALCANWTHFDRVGIATGDQALARYQDLRSFDDLQGPLAALIPTPVFPDLDKALKFVSNNYPLEEGMTTRDVIFFTASTDADEINRAQQSAAAVKSLGRLITVGIGLTDVSVLAPLASTNSTVAFTNFTDFSSTAAQINQMIL